MYIYKGFSEVSVDTLSYLLQSDRLTMEEKDILDKVKECMIDLHSSPGGRGMHMGKLGCPFHNIWFSIMNTNTWSFNSYCSACVHVCHSNTTLSLYMCSVLVPVHILMNACLYSSEVYPLYYKQLVHLVG